MRKLIYICSPIKANGFSTFDENIENIKKYCKFVCDKNLIPVASYLMFSFMDDNNESERAVCLEYGKQLLFLCSELWVFGEYVSDGMKGEIEFAKEKNITVKYIRGVE